MIGLDRVIFFGGFVVFLFSEVCFVSVETGKAEIQNKIHVKGVLKLIIRVSFV